MQYSLQNKVSIPFHLIVSGYMEQGEFASRAPSSNLRGCGARIQWELLAAAALLLSASWNETVKVCIGEDGRAAYCVLVFQNSA